MTVVDGARAGHWIRSTPGIGDGPLVRQQVPPIYGAYARILHPALDPDGRPVRWKQIADKFDRISHPLMQWNAIIRLTSSPDHPLPSWLSRGPALGELEVEPLSHLCTVLSKYTASPANVFYGLSTIHSGVHAAFPEATTLSLPQRDFVVLSSPLSAATSLGFVGGQATRVSFRAENSRTINELPSKGQFMQISPNLLWPTDHSWFVSSEYEFDSTLVGGSETLVAELLSHPDLETWLVKPEDSLSSTADTINAKNSP